MVNRLKNSFKAHFSNGPKAIFIFALVLVGATIIITANRKTVTVSIDGKEMKVVTFRKTVGDMLKSNNIIVGPKDKTTPSLDIGVNNGDKIFIKKAVDIEVAVDGKDLKIKTAEDTIEKALDAEGIEVADFDKVSPSVKEPIVEGLKVVVTRVDSKVLKESMPIDFTTVVKKDDESEKGSTKILQSGQTGEKLITTRVIYENGKEIKRQVVSEVVTKQPVQKIVAMGTLGSISSSRGGKVLYTRSVKVRATAYTADYASTGKSPGDYGFGRTATGTTVRRNPNGYSSIAVDPRVIPLGTKLYVEGYGYAVAEDTGGAIQGNTIDVFFNSNSEVNNWGVRYVNVYFVK